MRLKFFAVLFLLPVFGDAQPQFVKVTFNVNFENVVTAQKRIDGVIFDGKKPLSIRQGQSTENYLSGEYEFAFTVAVQGGSGEYKFNSGVIRILPQDTMTLNFTIPDSLLPSVQNLMFVEKSCPFYPEDIYDTLSCVDQSGQKQGLWLSHSAVDGNCIDWLEYHCDVYRDNKLWIDLDFKFDYNTCEKVPYFLTVKTFDLKSDKILAMHQYEIDRGYGVNVAAGTNKGVDHNQFTVYEMKRMLWEFVDTDYQNFTPEFLIVKGLSGSYTYTSKKGKVKLNRWDVASNVPEN